VDDIRDSWGFRDEEGFKVVVRGRGKDCSAVIEGRETLRSALEGVVVRYECAYSNKDAPPVEERRNVYV
jgi:hypothetical protein